MPVELVGATCVAGRATAQVRRALANREVETLDERGVQGLGILRLPQRSLQPTRRADPPAPFDSDAAIVLPSLEHVTLDARRPKEALNHPTVVLEPIGRDQRESHHASAEDDVVEDGRGVSRSGRPGSLLTLAPHRSGRAGSAASGSSTDSFATRRRVPAGPGSQAMATAIPKACLASSAIRCRDVETGPNLGVLAVFPSNGATCRCLLPSTGSRGLNSPASAVL